MQFPENGGLAQTIALGGLRFREANLLEAMAGAQTRFAAAKLADITNRMSAPAAYFQHRATSFLYYNREHFVVTRGV